MSKRNSNEFRQNATNRRGIVVDRDPAKRKVKVRFEDEDDVVTHWIDVPGGSAGAVKFYSMPGLEDEVWCAMDAKGEAGCLLGSRYNEKDAPPFSGNDDVGIVFPGGSIHVDTASGVATINLTGGFVITAPSGELN